MRYSALADSKCIRAGLIFASGNLNKEISNSALTDMATSIELMHTYSLIHDDLPSMDNDEMRRGQASNHIKFNEATAILTCLLYTSPSPRDATLSRMPSSA